MGHNYVMDGNTQIPSSRSENNDEVPIWTILGDEDSSLDRYQRIEDNKNESYLFHPHILQARNLEKYYDLFKVFSMHNNETITLCLAAFKTLICETPGIFTKESAFEALNYLSSDMKNEVFSKLLKYHWIVSNGIRYEIPTHARALSMFFSTTFNNENSNDEKDINLSFALTDFDDIAGSDEDIAQSNLQGAIGLLKQKKAEMEQALEQKSPALIKKIAYEGDILRALQGVEKRFKKRNLKKYMYSLTTEVLGLSADINALYHKIIEYMLLEIQANARAFGKYLNPEQVDEFIEKVSIDFLSNLVKKRFASPRIVFHISKEEILQRGIAYLQRKPEIQEPAPPPPIAEIEKRQVVVSNAEGDINAFYRELLFSLERKPVIPLPEVVVKNTFGQSLYRTGLLVTIRNELSLTPSKQQFELQLEGKIEILEKGPVELITYGVVKLKDAEGG
ncbi:MAG: hypothetical protein AB2421_14115 [Thermotaleaceae bacterium]